MKVLSLSFAHLQHTVAEKNPSFLNQRPVLLNLYHPFGRKDFHLPRKPHRTAGVHPGLTLLQHAAVVPGQWWKRSITSLALGPGLSLCPAPHPICASTSRSIIKLPLKRQEAKPKIDGTYALQEQPFSVPWSLSTAVSCPLRAPHQVCDLGDPLPRQRGKNPGCKAEHLNHAALWGESSLCFVYQWLLLPGNIRVGSCLPSRKQAGWRQEPAHAFINKTPRLFSTA